MPRAGDYRHQVTLQSPPTSTNAFNELTGSWTDEATVWAAIEWGSGRRFLEASQLNSEVQGIVRIRYRSDIDATWRISYKSRTFQIISIANVYERNREMVITCKEALD